MDTPLRELGPNDVKIKTVISTISCGTEKANITGNVNVSIFEEAKEAVFPRYGGYSCAGIVIETGSDVKSVSVGDRVAVSNSAHRQINIVGERSVVKIGGHSKGSSIVEFKKSGKDYVIVGDECYLRDYFDVNAQKTLNENSMKFYKTYSDPKYVLLYSHDNS